MGDCQQLRELLKQNERLTKARSSFGHRATLLHYWAANGVEIRRQKIPLNAVEMAKMLIAAGADVNARANCYAANSIRWRCWSPARTRPKRM
ncbi:MAG: hypothetical protein ACE5HS_18020 [bacterium]